MKRKSKGIFEEDLDEDEEELREALLRELGIDKKGKKDKDNTHQARDKSEG